MNAHDRDVLIKIALTPGGDVRLPAGLENDIQAAIAETPQRRPGLTARLGARLLPGVPPRLIPMVLALVLLLLLAVALAVGSQLLRPTRNDVLNYHGDPAQTGIMPGPAFDGPPVFAWGANLTAPLNALNMPLVSDGRVYVADAKGTVLVFNDLTGEPRSPAMAIGRTSGTPVIAGGFIVGTSDAGNVTAFDRDTGIARWQHAVGAATIASLAVLDDRVLVGSDDGHVHVIDLRTGDETGQLDASGPVDRSPAIADGVAYVAAVGGHVRTYAVASGKESWGLELGPGEVATPAVSGGVMYVARGEREGTQPYEVVALEVRNGAIRWRWAAPAHHRLFVAAVSHSTVYAGSDDGNLYAIDIATGRGGPFFATKGMLGSPATIVDGVIYLTSADQHVYAIDLATGSLRWAYATRGIPTTPVVVDGRLIVGTDLGKLIALKGSSATPTP
jgi:outer membrane protein assembly factor BamB